MSTIAWCNFIILNIINVLTWWIYIRSVQPYSRAKKCGETAWKIAKRDRLISGILLGITVIQLILWYWFPIPSLAWPVSFNWLHSILIGVILACIFTPIMIKGVMDAGRETMEPLESTKMYTGIYNHIRHPQMVGELPWYIIIAFFLNSLFLVIYSTIVIVILTPIVIYYEEKDLVKRFGEKYREYQRRTGAVFPKLRKPKD
jgi:protein-S-isoprenylcysteine O-methyltransferase Ste14